MSEQKKLFLLDAMALIYRAYYAFIKTPRVTSKGQNTSAVFGFTNTLLELLNKEKPTHIAVVFDTAAPTARHTDFTEYKAHREEMPEDIGSSIPYIQAIVRAFNIPVLYADGYEADDVIGTLARQAEQQGFTTYMMTPDKDFGQLVTDKIFIYKPASFGNEAQVLGVKDVLKKFEIQNVDQIRDLLGLWGDASDNIPGIPGIGEKTAKQLIAQYGSIENMIAEKDSLKGKLKEKVETYAAQALMSKKLATIICDAPVDFNEEALSRKEPDREKLETIFNELEFRTLGKRVFGENNPSEGNPKLSISTSSKKEIKKEKAIQKTMSLFPESETISNPLITPTKDFEEELLSPSLMMEVPNPSELKNILDRNHQYHLINTMEQRSKLVLKMQSQHTICFDTETTGIDANNAELVGLSFSFKEGEAFYVPIPENYGEAQSVVNEFKLIFENESIEKIGQNLKYDIIMLKWYDVEVKGKMFDTMLAHYLIEADMRHNMNYLSEIYLHYTPIPIDTLIGTKKSQQGSMRDAPIEKLVEYACEDADITLQLKNTFAPLLIEKNAAKLFNEVEIPLINVLVDMETEGVALDRKVLEELSREIADLIVALGQEIYQISGTQFNIASPRQLGEVLFDKLKIESSGKKTRGGQYATGEEILSKLSGKHPIIEKILDYRELQKLKNTYIDTLPSLINPRTGRIHTSFSQAVAVTGRLSSNNPNLQNIPIRTAKGKEIRKAFIPRNENYLLFSADYSQIELRIIAELSGDSAMIEAFRKEHDIHTATAAKVYGISSDLVTSDMRRNAKMVNFGIIYGISAFGLSQRLNIPRKEAAAIIDNYFSQYPDIKKYMDDSIRLARTNGYVETILGRRRYLRDINSQNAVVRGFAERNAINAPIQGSAADMIKVAMINIHKDFKEKKLKSKMTLQVHDELVFDVRKEELGEVKKIVEYRMKTAIPLSVPIEVETGTGRNWLEAH